MICNEPHGYLTAIFFITGSTNPNQLLDPASKKMRILQGLWIVASPRGSKLAGEIHHL